MPDYWISNAMLIKGIKYIYTYIKNNRNERSRYRYNDICKARL